MNDSEYYAHSTPTRDGRLEELVDSLFDVVGKVIEEDDKKENISKRNSPIKSLHSKTV